MCNHTQYFLEYFRQICPLNPSFPHYFSTINHISEMLYLHMTCKQNLIKFSWYNLIKYMFVQPLNSITYSNCTYRVSNSREHRTYEDLQCNTTCHMKFMKKHGWSTTMTLWLKLFRKSSPKKRRWTGSERLTLPLLSTTVPEKGVDGERHTTVFK